MHSLGWIALCALAGAILMLTYRILRYIILPHSVLRWRKFIQPHVARTIKSGKNRKLRSLAERSVATMLNHPKSAQVLSRLEYPHTTLFALHVFDAAVVWVALARDVMPAEVVEATVTKLCEGADTFLKNGFTES